MDLGGFDDPFSPDGSEVKKSPRSSSSGAAKPEPPKSQQLPKTPRRSEASSAGSPEFAAFEARFSEGEPGFEADFSAFEPPAAPGEFGGSGAFEPAKFEASFDNPLAEPDDGEIQPATAPTPAPPVARKSEGELEISEITDDDDDDDDEEEEDQGPKDIAVKKLQGFTIKPGASPNAGPSYFDDPVPAKTSGLFDDSPPAAPAPAAFEAKFDDPPPAAPATFEAKFDDPPPAAPATKEPTKTDPEDEFATDDEKEEPTKTALADDVARLGVPRMSDADRDEFFDVFERRAGSAEEAMPGGMLVAVTADTGLEQGDLSAIWQLVSAPGASSLTREDFAMFMHLMRHVLAGGELPESMDDAERVRVMGPEHGTRRAPSPPPPPPPPADHPLVVVVESFANVKDAKKFKNANVSVVLVDGEGEPLCPAATTPMGSGIPRSDGSIVFNAPVPLDATYDAIPRGGGLVLELRHFKAKEKKMSVKCWAYVAAASVARGESAATATLAKPTDRSGRRRKNFGKGESDVRVSFR